MVVGGVGWVAAAVSGCALLATVDGAIWGRGSGMRDKWVVVVVVVVGVGGEENAACWKKCISM